MPEDHSMSRDDYSSDERKNLAGLLGFAEEVLVARSKVQMVMQQGLGVFHEGDMAGLPGVEFDCEDGTWLRLRRQRETKAPDPVEHVTQFLKGKPTDPTKPPQLKQAISIEVTIEEASDLEESGLLKSDDVHPIVEDDITLENRVKVVLHAENLPEMRRDFESYVGGAWSDWAKQEAPVRQAISLYNDLFKIHSAIHTSEGAPPELIWGIGIGRWRTAGERVDMPLIEQSVDIEVEDGGSIAIRPRNLAPSLSLKPYIELNLDGAAKLQRELKDRLAQLLKGDAEFSPFTTICEPILDTAANNLSSDGALITRAALDEGEKLAPAGEQLRVTSSWAIFGRPRSNEVRVQDLSALRKQVEDEKAEVPKSIKGYTAKPMDEAPQDVSAFGLDTAVLGGATSKGWESSSGSEGRKVHVPGAGGARAAKKEEDGRVHFFPLPFNDEQGKISDMIDDPKLDVACVSGPPGTGKSHSIANIISHQMAMGKRVLVTARTPEAIAAVREKLPESLRPLAIASVGTDRESAQQLQDAVTALSNQVVNLDVDDAQAERVRLEQRIIECDETARKADKELARIARENLSPLEWNGAQSNPMELVEILGKDEERFGWFTDRPRDLPTDQLSETLSRLRATLPELAADIVYAGASLPAAEDLPTAQEIISAHQQELAWNTREVVDYSSAPTMALDGAGVEERAQKLLSDLTAIEETVCDAREPVRSLAVMAMEGSSRIDSRAMLRLLKEIDAYKELEEIKTIRFELHSCSREEFLSAATRGAAGQKPVGFGLFNSGLKNAVASVRIGDKAPADASDWRRVVLACRLQKDRESITESFQPLIDHKLAPFVPGQPSQIAEYLLNRKKELSAALDIAERLRPATEALRPLFPYGLDIDDICRSLDCKPAIFAIRGNMPEGYSPPAALTQLRSIAGAGDLPILGALSGLADALGKSETDPGDIVKARSEFTKELDRLTKVAEKLKLLGVDLDTLKEAGAPEWAFRLEAAPEQASDLIPDDWRAAWAWARMKGRVDRIIALGNGDEHRKAKAEAMARRRKHLEELIRIRTLLGLKVRMTKPIRQAMESFTQAVSKIGTGKGKKAPRFIRAAQEAAKQASAAAPVWIMPEYKIPEQLPAKFGDFDLVILDEASQSDITALAALARGKKILVVGDEEQVSPSVVGIAAQKINALRAQFLDQLPSADLIDENSSIFEITKRMHPESHVMLREHFRCVAPIIQFSSRYYNNSLIPLRVPKASERFDPPLCDVFIPAAARKGKTNHAEAQWIVDEIAKLIKDPAHKGRDIGVISLIGGEQAEKIGRMLVEDPRVGPEQIKERRIIYGDARTMQGQERSIVFLSMVATPGQAHAQTKKDDQQRINVAMSRAKDRLYLVRSVQLEDLSPTDVKVQIIQHFIDPMPDGRAATKGEITDLMERCDSGFEREVLKRLMDANYRVRPQVPAGGFKIDLVVEGAEDRRLAIELDGDLYHGPDVWDKDMERQAALERAGWVFWRVFGSQWSANKEFWWSSLRETLDRLGIGPIGAAAVDERFTESIIAGLRDDDEEETSKDISDQLTSASDEPDDPRRAPTSPEALRRPQQGHFDLLEGLFSAETAGAPPASPSGSATLDEHGISVKVPQFDLDED